MEFEKLMETRRSVRKYKREGVLPCKTFLTLIEAALEAPSWKNSQTGRYHCIVSPEKAEAFRNECLLSGNSEKSKNAALIVTTFVKNHAGFQRDGSADNELGNGWGIYDLGLQNENLILKAAEMGLSTLIMGIRDADKIRAFLNIPEKEIIVSVIAVGTADEAPLRPKRKAPEEVIRFY